MLDKILDILQQHPNSDMQSMFGYLEAHQLNDQRKVRRALSEASKDNLITCSADNGGKSLRMVYRLNGDDPPEDTRPLREPYQTRREKQHREKQKRANNRARKQVDNAAIARPIGEDQIPTVRILPDICSEEAQLKPWLWDALYPNPNKPYTENVPTPEPETTNVNEEQTQLQQRIDAELQSTSKLAHALRQNGRITNYELKIQVLTKLSELFSEDIDFVLAEITDDLRNYEALVGRASE